MNKKGILLGSVIMMSLFLVGCGERSIQEGDKVSLVMIGNFENQDIFENTEATITVGKGEIIAGIDGALIGMKEGETKTITITPEQGYGSEYKAINIQKISKLVFDKMSIATNKGDEINLGTFKGRVIGTEEDENGNTIILFDINPPQTWKPLIYNILIKTVEKEAK